MDRRAIISDVHGNLEALEAVLSDIQSEGISTVYCLGDVIGYGPNPCQCIDRVMQLTACILGNHDQAALFDPEGFSSGAERAIFWTRGQLEAAGNTPENTARWRFLCELPRQRHEGDLSFVHGSARNPLMEYVFPEDIHNPGKLQRIFSVIRRYCFQGHTHVPGIFTESGKFIRPSELQGAYRFGNEKLMINVGSVGQPRDGNPMASYVILNGDEVSFRRIAYPVETTVAKVHAIPELDNFLGDRLREGR
ncbi:MAG: metallophosphoesterase family protein [Planctomycetales bacterium]|nr:metallophosphoesterase family protein [Planctomycetales bacterium]